MDKQQIVKSIEFLSQCLSMPFLYTVQYYFYKRFLGFKVKVEKFIIYMLLFSIISLYVSKFQCEILGKTISDLVWIFIICFLCKGNFIIKLYAVAVENTIRLLISMAFLIVDFKVLPMTHNTNMSFNEHMVISSFNIILGDFTRIILLFIFLKIICNLLSLRGKRIDLYESLCLLIPCLSIYSLVAIFYFIQIIKVNNKEYYLAYLFPRIYYILPCTSFALMVSILITAYIFQKMLQGKEEMQKNMLMHQQFNLQCNYSKNVEGLYKEIRGVMHDMNNHLNCLKSLAINNNIEEMKGYIDNIGQTMSKLDFKIKTGNPVSDAVMNEKYNIAKVEGIKFTCDFIMPKKTLVEPMDLCVILSNALDNSIEACKRIKDTSIDRKIFIKSYVREIYLIIEISNTCIDKIQYVEDKIITQKLDKLNHGIGISNIEATVKKYNGIIDILQEKNKFVVNLMLKIK
ncbi:histidine kinase [Clostridium carboxidivorans P7]|uniref:Sensor histidine kinase n=3 Tax=Clostridium TaxID=1485 RepID=C6PQC1_9CLOT|nr:sensor histidine kinase [Clostridium carboxidivorans]AKN33048.1 histidine kinase [Clostridium carboxidivorans P7]EET88591.1 sensor histidine kinase [Clostridium carboxidivorans P7]